MCILFDPAIPLTGTYTQVIVTHTKNLVPVLYVGANI